VLGDAADLGLHGRLIHTNRQRSPLVPQ
jgi:hypothetical protein